MWPRVVELLLACWLAISPSYVFGHDPSATWLWIVDYAAALIVGVAALLSFHRRMFRAHLVTLGVALALIAMAFSVDENPPPPAHQNFMAVGLLLLMFAILPSRCEQPPRRWREFVAGRDGARRSSSD